MSCKNGDPVSARNNCIQFREGIVSLGINDQSWKPRSCPGSYWVLLHPMICVMHDPLGAPRHRGSAPRCIGPRLSENSSPTTYRNCRTGREPGAPVRYEVRRASPVPSLQVPGTDLSDCAIGRRFRSDRVQGLRLENETAGKHACGKMMHLRKADPSNKTKPQG